MSGYYVDMVTPLQLIPETFSNWITSEIREGGLLEEIDAYCQTFRTEGTVQSHEIWVHKENWQINDETRTFTMGDSYVTMDYPFTVAIIVDMIDEDTSERKAIQLQAKTIMAIMKNYQRNIFETERDGFINYFVIDEGYNDGYLDAINREDDVIIKGFRITFNIDIYWLECYYRRQKQLEGGTTENG
ncbi:hypothetical protein PXD04_10390 [Methanosphaera sp. ISO3-F5]|uniref:hypothetical protein n=1 Tax=Methanosphaera sp. ISO3-F5 TaxID=1452353 RepID=UPI002B25BA73|nr:hypothetical protein [Methanosphaera sp. ISO3-F5]WQH64099.1 hypothetical protein PXD04_10390 [Methanosphaera sp. ISO3-F5]